LKLVRYTVRGVRRFACGVAMSIVGAMLAAAIWLAFYAPGASDSVIPLVTVYLFGGAGLIYGMWVGEEVPRLRRHLVGILVFTALSLGALAGASRLRAERSAALLEQPVENTDAARQ